MGITVLLPGLLATQAGGKDRFELDAPTVGAALRALPISDLIFDEAGELRGLVNVYVDGKDMRTRDGLDTSLEGEEEIRVVAAIAGGASVQLGDGVSLYVEELGEGLPVIVLHGGPGVDHSMFRPYLDPLAEDFRLIYVDERGQGRSERVDPETLSLEVFARDVDLLAEALELDRFALLGHSFGAIIATFQAIELGTADAYVVSGGGDASDPMMADVEASLRALGDQGTEIAASWEQEQTVQSEEELAELMRVQMPFHFAGEVPSGYGDDIVFSPDVLRHFAQAGYGNFDYRPDLRRIDRPTLVIVGEHDRTTTPRAARVLHEGIPGSELVMIGAAGHMCLVEKPDEYLAAVRAFLSRAA